MSPHYDEVFHTVVARAEQDESIGKAEIGALVPWKRLNASTKWALALMQTPDGEVRAATGAAYAAARNRGKSIFDAAFTARGALSALPGFGSGDALASAIICALAPTRMAVYDRRAQAGLQRLELTLTPKSGRHARYMKLLEQLGAEVAAAGTPMSAREIDTALYQLGG
ncbi:MAG: hypothetical protein Q7T56_20005 [Nocardioidaceae bacterium]|nr:hypothetical protein [Nocardioidaceae bacterium]